MKDKVEQDLTFGCKVAWGARDGNYGKTNIGIFLGEKEVTLYGWNTQTQALVKNIETNRTTTQPPSILVRYGDI